MNKLKCIMRINICHEDAAFGPGVARLMELVDESNSVSEACRSMGMAYSKAWKLIKRAETDLGIKLLNGERGGRNGGGTSITDEGREFLRKYRLMEAELKAQRDLIFEKYFE